MNIKLKKFFYRHKIISVIAILLIFAAIFFTIVDLSLYIPVKMEPNTTKSSFGATKSKVYVQKGKEDKVNNTLSFYKNILENNNNYIVDGFEITVFMSKDNRLIVAENDLLDSFTNCKVNPFSQKNAKISSKTVGELKQYNAAYFMGEKDGYPYRNIGIDLSYFRIITLDELIVYLNTQSVDWKKTFNLIINIGDKNNLNNIVSQLNTTLKDYNYAKNCVVVTKSDYLKSILENYPDLMRTASNSEVSDLYFKAAFGVKDIEVSYDILYVNAFNSGVNLARNRIVDYARYCDIPIIFKDISSIKKIQKTANLKPDGIAGILPKDIYLETIK